MARNTEGRMSREAFRGLIKLIAERLDLDTRQANHLHNLLSSMVFADELDQAVADHVEELH